MTEKQMRALLHKVWYRWEKLQSALNEAHDAGLIKYPDELNGRWPVDTCCNQNWETRKSFQKYTKDQIAAVINSEIWSQV